MPVDCIVTDGYFDGTRHVGQGPYTVVLREGRIAAIHPGVVQGPPGARWRRAAYLLPGLVEAHCHLFLDGGELDPARRAAYLRADRAQMLATGRASLRRSLEAGVTLLRDAGDIHGINLALRAEARLQPARWPAVRCPGAAVRQAGRYGGFMAREASPAMPVERLVEELAPEADEIKVLLTGIIDFEAAAVKGAPQFTQEEAHRIARAARAQGRRTFVHCSGAEGIDIALAAGFDSIEHGFFVTREQLVRMADRGTTWVPTFSPVHFQLRRPEFAGWSAGTVRNLDRILDAHADSLRQAYALGVRVLVGSDAGSHGVPHGTGCIAEIERMAGTGAALSQVLQSATSVPRAAWGLDAPGEIRPGVWADLLLLGQSPFEDLGALRRPLAVFHGAWLEPQAQAAEALA